MRSKSKDLQLSEKDGKGQNTNWLHLMRQKNIDIQSVNAGHIHSLATLLTSNASKCKKITQQPLFASRYTDMLNLYCNAAIAYVLVKSQEDIEVGVRCSTGNLGEQSRGADGVMRYTVITITLSQLLPA